AANSCSVRWANVVSSTYGVKKERRRARHGVLFLMGDQPPTYPVIRRITQGVSGAASPPWLPARYPPSSVRPVPELCTNHLGQTSHWKERSWRPELPPLAGTRPRSPALHLAKLPGTSIPRSDDRPRRHSLSRTEAAPGFWTRDWQSCSGS